LLKFLVKFSVVPILVAAASLAPAAQLSTDARTAIPRDVQQLVVIDYRAMQNSAAAMDLKERVMPPDLKQFDDALRKSGLNDNHDVDQLAFALFRPSATSEGLTTLGMVICFVDASTMVFGSKEAVEKALDARDGVSQSMLNNSQMMDAMRSVDSQPLWSILDEKGTQTMMRQVLGEAGSLTDFESVRKRLIGSWYGMDFQHGVKFDLTISTGDSFAAATISSLLTAAVLVRKMSGSDAEKAALKATDISSDSGKLGIHFATSDSEFNNLLHSPLFQSMVR
jgi:hypothetical protein